MMLNSLVIKNFRMLEDFTVEKLGRVNLIVGKNNSGKSTVLEALRIYAGNANFQLLKSIADSHDEIIEDFSIDDFRGITGVAPEIIGEILRYDDEDIRNVSYDELLTTNIECEFISIGESSTTNELFLKLWYVATYEGNRHVFNVKDNLVTRAACSFIPTNFISMHELEAEWKQIELTDGYDIVTQALQIILPSFQRLAFDGDDKKHWVKVKLASLPDPVPLKSLGDGMLRLLQIAINLVSAQGGFLLIDEFENGLHYSVQEDVWRLLFEMAEKMNIQVFATTHSWDCIESFTKVALENETTEGILFRMGRSAVNRTIGEREIKKRQIIATVYDKEALYDLTQMDMEIR